MSVDLSKARHWRLRAGDVRAKADTMRTPETAAGMRQLAETYDALADGEELLAQARERIRRLNQS